MNQTRYPDPVLPALAFRKRSARSGGTQNQGNHSLFRRRIISDRHFLYGLIVLWLVITGLSTLLMLIAQHAPA